MLITSHRHTADDLRLWAEYERADLAHGHSARVGRLAEAAIDAIRRFVCAGPCYLSVSWGKDSTVLLHLTAIAGVDIPVVHFRSPEDKYPHDDDVRRAFCDRWPVDYHEHVVKWPQRGVADWRKRNALAERLHGARRRIIGVRADESASRRLSAMTHGVATELVCRPLLRWTAQDVFGYAAAYDVPLHPSYAMLGGGRWDRSRLRVSGLGGAPGCGLGRAEWEREYYGDVLHRLAAR